MNLDRVGRGMIGRRGHVSRFCWALSVLLGSGGIGAGVDACAATLQAHAAQRLVQRFPRAQVSTYGTGRTAIYGTPMTAGATPGIAADRFLSAFAPALSVNALDLQLADQTRLGSERFFVLRYKQSIDGLPVEHGIARVVVWHGGTDRVVYAGANAAIRPDGGFAPQTIDPAVAVAAVQQLPAYAHLSSWSQPELVVYFEGLPQAVRCWKFLGTQPDPATFAAFTFFVDAAGGDLVHVRDEVYIVDVQGHVEGMASPGTLPDVNYNLPEWMALENARVRVQGGSSTYTDENGDAVIPHSGTLPVTVEGDLIGQWVQVFNAQGANVHVQEMVTPPGPFQFDFNPAPAQFTTAQVNGFIHTTLVHDFYKDRQPQYDGLDLRIPCNVNITDSPIFPCNAFFTNAGGPSINFFAVGGGCVNSAYSSVIAHEYGHFIVNTLGLAQGAFGEGFGDTMSVLLYDDPITGRDFAGPGNHIRNLATPNITYPCFSEIHQCGRVLAGTWWDIRTEMGATYGEPEGLERTQQLCTDWSQITVGGLDSQAAHPQTAVEALTVDDDDGELANGTPHYFEICAGFADHNIACPLDCNGNGVPDFEDIAEGTSMDEDGNNVPDECHGIRRVPAEFPSIQSAINAAEDGDTVLVAAGTYHENVSVSTNIRNILIKSVAGPEQTILDGGRNGSVIRFQNLQQFPPNDGLTDAVLDGFTITNGSADAGGGVHCFNANPRIENCRVIGNFAGFEGGAGVYAEDGFPSIQDCEIADNHSTGLGGGMRFDDATATVRNCMIRDNQANFEGGALFGFWGSVTLASSSVTANSGQSAVAFNNGVHDIRNSILWEDLPPENPELSLFNGTLVVDYSDVEGGIQSGIQSTGNLVWEEHNLSEEPLFVPGPVGCFYLSQTAAGQPAQSPCIDAASENTANSASGTRTTRSDEATDTGTADMGFHYPVTGLPLLMGDFERDQDVDLIDMGRLQACFSGVGPADVPPCCRIFDFALDGDVDLEDYAAFQDAFTGPQ